MTKIGIVQNALHLHGDLIISVDVEENAETRINIGDIVRFHDFGKMPISGLKFWREQRKIDLFVKGDLGEPRIGEAVYI